uniref:Putative methyltransferase n=1 Tax=viral metagenome TaxID=1070528 RepID=A0A6M3JYY0_9ZZZZ
MGIQQKSDWYDKKYLEKQSEYDKHFSNCIYFPLWLCIMKRLSQKMKIIDLGCGVGQFAEMLHVHGFRNYTGIDFSEVAINKAKSKNLKGYNFILQNITTEPLPEGDIYIACEVLEHIENDIDIVRKIKWNTLLIASLPIFDYESHVRYFTSENEIIKRYEDYLDFRFLTMVGNYYWCFEAKRKLPIQETYQFSYPRKEYVFRDYVLI